MDKMKLIWDEHEFRRRVLRIENKIEAGTNDADDLALLDILRQRLELAEIRVRVALGGDTAIPWAVSL